MKLVKRIGAFRHFIAVAVLGIAFTLFVPRYTNATQQKSGLLDDPVISGMAWEVGNEDSDLGVLSDGPVVFCEANCDGNCDANCNSNCDKNSNCPTNGNCPGNC